MRSLLVVCTLISVLALTAGMANAANPGQVPNSALAQLGLSGMQPMSDVQGTDIRGMGFVFVTGYALAPTGSSGRDCWLRGRGNWIHCLCHWRRFGRCPRPPDLFRRCGRRWGGLFRHQVALPAIRV